MKAPFPMRINKYLAHKGYTTRRGADDLIESGKVYINGVRAQLGSKVHETDIVDIKNAPKKTYRYVAYHKPKGVETHSPIKELFYVGRLDKQSSGLLLLTNDGRITDRLLNPAHPHEKEYDVTVREQVPNFVQKVFARGVDLGDFTTKPATVRPIHNNAFRIILTEGKKHQIRRMCDAVHLTITQLVRVRIMHIQLGTLPEGNYRELTVAEKNGLLKTLGL